jgi:hypothetical protein
MYRRGSHPNKVKKKRIHHRELNDSYDAGTFGTGTHLTYYGKIVLPGYGYPLESDPDNSGPGSGTALL